MTAEAQRNLEMFSGRWDASMARMSMNMRELEGLTTKWNKAFMGMGIAMGIGAAAVGGAFYGIYKVVAPFEASLRRLSFYLDDFDEEMNEVGETTWKVANVVKKSCELFGYSTDLAMDGMVKLAKMLELTSDEMIYFASILIPAAVAAQMDLEAVAMVLVKVLHAFNIETERAGYVLDYLRAVADKAELEMEDFLDAVQHGGSIAYLAGMSFEEFVRIIAALDLHAVKTGKSGRALVQIIGEFASIGPEAEESWQAFCDVLGISVPMMIDNKLNLLGMVEAVSENIDKWGVLQVTIDRMSKRAAQVFTAMLVGAQTYRELSDSMEKSGDIMGSNARLAMIYSTSLEGMIATMKEVFFNAFKTDEVMLILHDTMYLLGETVKKLTPIILTFVIALLEMSPELIHMLGEALLLLAGKSGALLEIIRTLTHTLEAVALMFAMLPEPIISLLIYGALLIHLIKPFMIAAFHAWEMRIAATTILNQALAFSIGHLMMAMSMMLASVFLVIMATDQWKRGNKALAIVMGVLSGILLIVAANHIAAATTCMLEALAYKYLAFAAWDAAAAEMAAWVMTGIGILVAIAAVAAIVLLIISMQQYRDELMAGTEATEEYTDRMKAYQALMKEITGGMKGFTASGEQAAWTISGLSGLMARGKVNAEMYRDVMIILAEDCTGVTMAFGELKTWVGYTNDSIEDFQTTAEGADYGNAVLQLNNVEGASEDAAWDLGDFLAKLDAINNYVLNTSGAVGGLNDVETAADDAKTASEDASDSFLFYPPGDLDTRKKAITDTLSDIKIALGDLMLAFGKACYDLMMWLGKSFIDFGGWVVALTSLIYDAITGIIGGAAAAWVDLWTAPEIGGYKLPEGDITEHQYGIIAASPQLAMIGEAGPEAVIPLTGISAGKAGLGTSALGTASITVNMDKVYVSNDYDVKRLARQVGRELMLDLRRRATIGA